jgi:hypothetical protein
MAGNKKKKPITEGIARKVKTNKAGRLIEVQMIEQLFSCFFVGHGVLNYKYKYTTGSEFRLKHFISEV